MSSSTYAGNPDVMIAGLPPPPPPPPPMSGQLPPMRINTTENMAAKKAQIINNDVYEPPAAIQNAMLTKDKKPFTYTPGMGGKLDLSQIRSPRMARRVAKNANDEGIEGPPKLAVESKPSASTATNFLIQPQVAVPVFPSNVPAQTHINRTSSSQLINRTPSNAAENKEVESPKNITKIDTKVSINSNPESPSTPTQVTLAKAPTPWLQNKNKPQEELPEWAKRACINKPVNNSSESMVSPTVYVQAQQSFPQHSETKQKQEQEQHSISQCQQSKSQQPSWQCQQQSQQQKQNAVSTTSQQINPQSHQHERVIPIRIEDRPSVFDVKHDSGHHQFKQQPTLHHQQRWGQMPSQYTLENQAQNRSQEQPIGTTYIIPIVVKDSDKKIMPSNIESNTTAKIVQQRNPNPIQQHDAGPVQSRSFRVLQKITDTDAVNDVGTEQIRKLELSEDERLLMNKFKEQVDHETYLHQEEDPRYRGAAIPSRAFRFLQNMTDSSDATVTCAAPRNVANKKQNRNSKLFEKTPINLPPSEQQVQEPKKYMGSAIPSRSFRILQAMTAPESNATQENRQADYTCRTENNLPGNQQSIFLPLQSIPFWYPEGWWGYYPVQYNAVSNETANKTDKHSFPFYAYPDGRIYIGSFYPIYNENFMDSMTQTGIMDGKNPSDQYAGYAAVVYPQANHNNIQTALHINENKCNYIHDHFTAADLFVAQNDKLDFVQNSIVNESKNTVLLNEINHLDAQSNDTYNPKNLNKNSNSNDREKNFIATAMNIIDEEDISTKNSNNIVITNNKIPGRKTFGLYINVPNYTYIDTSDSSASSDSSDSSDSISDNELSDSCKKNHNCSNDTTFNNTSSDSDSDSYIAYSTIINPYEKLEKDRRDFSLNENCNSITAACSISANNLRRHSQEFSENCDHIEEIHFKKKHIDYSNNCTNSHMTFQQDVASERCNDENFINDQNNLDSGNRHSEQHNLENLAPDSIVCHSQLDINHENVEQPNLENPYYKDKKNIESFFETTDDPSHVESTTVNVSLPLRFKFFVSEDNEDVTTVIVGNSKIKAEKFCDEYSLMKDDVCVNFHVGNDTSVDFTVKTHLSDSCSTISTQNEAMSIENAMQHVDFTLKKNSISKINCEEREQNAETEFTVKMGHDCEINFAKSASRNTDNYNAVSESIVATQNILLNQDLDHIQAKSTCNNNIENIAFGRMIAEPKVFILECSSMQDKFQISDFQIVDTQKTNQTNSAIIMTDNKYDQSIDQNFCETQNIKHPSNVQDSHENTDDEDSGVISDISRIISEVDTDSECTYLKNIKKYQRTQTHSRLFRLLNDDSILSDYSKKDPFRKKCLNLPLKKNAFYYNDYNYCSNYSSGLNSPKYSPIHEQSWQKIHENLSTNTSNSHKDTQADLVNVEIDHFANQQEQIFSKNDPYFRVWKNSKLCNLRKHDVIPSLAFKTLDSKIPSWAYKVNVLCPRIKSTKSVPQTLLAQHNDETNDPLRMVPSIPTSCTNSKTSYC